MAKMAKTSYTIDMSLYKEFLDIPKMDGWSGQDIHKLIENVEDDYNYHFKRRRTDPDRVIYYRDLLTYLVKTYVH